MNTSLPSGITLRLCFLLLVLSSLQACKKTQVESSLLTANDLVGEWKITAIQVSPNQNGTADALALANPLGGNTCLNQLVIGFDPTHKFHLDYAQAPGCFQGRQTDYVGYFTGLGGQEWSIDTNQLVLKNTGQTTQQGQTPTAATVVARYEVSLQGDQMIWHYQVQRDQQIDPNQTVFKGSDSILMAYTITLHNVWRP